MGVDATLLEFSEWTLAVSMVLNSLLATFAFSVN